MNHPPGTSRTIVKERYALFSPDGFVPSTLPGWSGCTPNVLISPALGADFVQMNVAFEKGARASGETEHGEMFVYVIAGKCSAVIANQKHSLGAGSYAFVPPETAYKFASQQKGTRLLVFQKYRESIDGHDAPAPLIGDSAKIKGAPFLGNPRALLQVLLPDTMPFDFAVNIFTYEPGAALPFVETHVMEHGLLMLAGAGVYRLDSDWHPVQAGDVIWMAPFCPQWFAAIGDGPASYIYYKDVNRSPL